MANGRTHTLLKDTNFRTSPASLVAQMVKCLPAMQETWVRSLGGEDPLEKEMETHSSTLAWKIPWTEEPGRLQSNGRRSLVGYSPWGCKESDMTERLHLHFRTSLVVQWLRIHLPMEWTRVRSLVREDP